MNIAILADIHGNVTALQAVLADVATQSPDLLVFGGDYVMNGSRPAEALALIRSTNAHSVIGNTDVYVLDMDDAVPAWVRQQLRADDLVFLRSLPLQQRITPPHGVSPQDDLLVVHSTPRNCDDLLILDPHPFGTSFTEITDDATAHAMLNGEAANLIVFGHIHYASARTIGVQRVVSIGSVGFPFDHDQRAAYALAHWDGNNWQIEHRRVSYDVQAAIDDLLTCGIPDAACYAERLRRADWLRCG